MSDCCTEFSRSSLMRKAVAQAGSMNTFGASARASRLVQAARASASRALSAISTEIVRAPRDAIAAA